MVLINMASPVTQIRQGSFEELCGPAVSPYLPAEKGIDPEWVRCAVLDAFVNLGIDAGDAQIARETRGWIASINSDFIEKIVHSEMALRELIRSGIAEAFRG